MSGDYGQPEATAEVLRDGWCHTGDLARRDEAGFLTITGRIKELIIRGGENIHPGEVEAVLREQPGVVDVAVVARPHEVLGEIPAAFVRARPGRDGSRTPARSMPGQAVAVQGAGRNLWNRSGSPHGVRQDRPAPAA